MTKRGKEAESALSGVPSSSQEARRGTFKIKIGTRRSPLALAQSNLVKQALEAKHSGLIVELVGIDTQGDEVHQNRFSNDPLNTLDGKNFFVKELDEALLDGRTDCSVHSYKDLSLDRPEGLMIAAIPERVNPRDVVLFRADIHEKIMRGETLTIGSSSPRRVENTVPFLSRMLNAIINMKPIRGNVGTRIRKLEEGFDGVVLALAGLIRLGLDVDAFPKVILPLDQCPTAPAQGALALECRSDDAETVALLNTLTHEPTASAIAAERSVLKTYGGGCHQAFGATSAGSFLYVRGKSDTGAPLDHVEFDAPTYSAPITAWDGGEYRAGEVKTIPLKLDDLKINDVVFVAHHRAVTEDVLPLLKGKRIWTSGHTSMQKLFELGLWVEGCGEGLGFDQIENMIPKPFTTLTHEGALDDWEDAIATYRIGLPDSPPEGLDQATHIWWASGSQFLAFKDLARNARHHACGAGKTADT